jgi:methylmalonyl-CoA mutase
MKPNPAPLFPSSTYEEWKAAAESLLKGAPFDKVMLTQTPEGITRQPIYLKESLDPQGPAATLPGADGYLRGARPDGYRVKPWEIAQELPYGDSTEFNQALLSDLSRGQDAVSVTPDLATLAGLDPDSAPIGDVAACGLSLASLADLKRAFRGVLPDAVSFHFQSGAGGLAIESLFLAWLAGKSVDATKISGSFNFDPLAILAGSGKLPTSPEQCYDEMAAAVSFNSSALPGFSTVGVSALPYHCAGASAVQELGALLATGLSYLRALGERGIGINEAAKQVRFTLSIGPDFFMEIAKLRAIRPLWARVVRELGGSEEAAVLRTHARTGLYNKTRHDPYVNMLRTTTEALSGVIGGVDSLAVGAFDECLGLPDEFSRRIARNTQVILQEECELTAVVDPAGGSWFIESLTAEVSRKSWDFFREIEKQGGIAKALESGFVQEQIAAVRKEAEQQLSQRRRSLVGTNQYPNLGEKSPAILLPEYEAIRVKRARELAAHRISGEAHADTVILNALGKIPSAGKEVIPHLVEAVSAGATIGEITRAVRSQAAASQAIAPLPNTRLALIYEELRAASQAFRAANGHGPQLYLANLGALRRHKPRTDFIRSFFETGGFEVINPAGSTDIATLASQAAASGAKLVVICGHDEDYPVHVSALIPAIKQAVPGVTVLLAGHPGDHEAAFKQAGLDDFIFVRSNNYQTNKRYLAALGVLPANA